MILIECIVIMRNFENYRNNNELIELRNDTEKLFLNNAYKAEVYTDVEDEDYPTVISLCGVVNYKGTKKTFIEVEVHNLFDIESGEKYVYLINDDCYSISSLEIKDLSRVERKIEKEEINYIRKVIEHTVWQT
jgi:hypothetical protein